MHIAETNSQKESRSLGSSCFHGDAPSNTVKLQPMTTTPKWNSNISNRKGIVSWINDHNILYALAAFSKWYGFQSSQENDILEMPNV